MANHADTITQAADTITEAPVTRTRKKWNIGRILAWTAMIAFLILSLFPFYWMLRTALSTTRSLSSDPSSRAARAHR